MMDNGLQSVAIFEPGLFCFNVCETSERKREAETERGSGGGDRDIVLFFSCIISYSVGKLRDF